MAENKSFHGLDLGLFINDQYVTVKKIGQGGFGVVWQAYDFSLRNFVAVKELRKEYSEQRFVEMFYKEALIAKNIIHDNIVRVQHFWKGSNGAYYISMDFVRGVDLEDVIAKCNALDIRIPWELSVLICINMLKAIDYANRIARDSITGKPFGIVYRDISPGNVLISFDGNVKLSDFGIAKTADEISEGIKQNVVTGKYPYMSPEQIKGDSDVDHRSDIFSIGVVLYEMLTGKQLFSGSNSEIKDQVINQKFNAASINGLKLPNEMKEILSKALEKARDERYVRAIEMYRDLRRLLKGVETEDLAVDLSSFISKVMESELNASDDVVRIVKSLDRNEVMNHPQIERVICHDFMVGDLSSPAQPDFQPKADSFKSAPAQPEIGPDSDIEIRPVPRTEARREARPEAMPEARPKPEARPSPEVRQPEAVPEENILPSSEPNPQFQDMPPRPAQPQRRQPVWVKDVTTENNNIEPVKAKQAVQPSPSQAPQAQEEAKGKTVFEEVGDWFVNKFKALKGRIIKIIIFIIFAILLFLGLDIFKQITPFGKAMYAKMYPPDVIITTVPSGAMVNMKTSDGEVILQNASSDQPIPLRKVQPRTYTITALKEGFRPVQRVVRIEERTSKSDKLKNEKIELTFDFDLDVNSVPQGADVFIDGNKFGVTPCKVNLSAGEHTLRLALAGFEDLGSKAKGHEDGYANIDFSRPNKAEIFGDVDKRYWETDLKNIDGENVFTVKGKLFKKYKFTSTPEKMTVHIEGEGKPRGSTPLTANIMAGEYKVRFLDPEGRYGESLNQVEISAKSASSLFVKMNKLITFRVKSQKNSAESFIAKLKIEGKEFQTTRNVGTGRPVTIPLPGGNYKFTFTADDFDPYVRNNVDVESINSVNASLVYSKVPFNVSAVYLEAQEGTEKENPIENAFVWIDDKPAGKTDAKGVWTDKFDPGQMKGRIVAEGYVEQLFDVELLPGKGFSHTVVMVRDLPVLPDIPEPVPGPDGPQIDPLAPLPPKPEPKQEDLQVILCPYCGYINTVPAGRKLRFCVNCAKPLK